MKILLIDDQPEVSQMILELLQLFGHQVDEFTVAPSKPTDEYDLALLDCSLGLEYIPLVRSRFRFLFTGGQPEEIPIHAKEQVDGLIQKPIMPDQLLQFMQLLQQLIDGEEIIVASKGQINWFQQPCISQSNDSTVSDSNTSPKVKP